MMKLGSYKLHIIETGKFCLDGGSVFGVVPKVLWSKKVNSDNLNRICLSARSLLIQDNKKNILVDCGLGHKYSDQEIDILNLDYSEFNIDNSLSRLGLTKVDISHVILTHLHFDHAGGATQKNEHGKIVPTFPNAIYYIQRKNLNWALNPSERDKFSYLKDNFLPLMDHNCLKPVSGELELFPQIQMKVYDGHTFAHQAVQVWDNHQTVFFAGDLIPTSAHLKPNWGMAFDLNPLISLNEKKNLLKICSEKEWILVFDHDPLIPACTIQSTQNGYEVKNVISF